MEGTLGLDLEGRGGERERKVDREKRGGKGRKGRRGGVEEGRREGGEEDSEGIFRLHWMSTLVLTHAKYDLTLTKSACSFMYMQ